MKSCQWDAKVNARIVLEGMQSKPVAARCHVYQIAQSQYSQWREPSLAHTAKAVEVRQDAQKDARLARQHMLSDVVRRHALRRH